MGSTLGLAAVQQSMRSLLLADVDIPHVYIEPYVEDVDTPSVNIFRSTIDFERITVGSRVYRAKPQFIFECVVFNMGYSVQELYETADDFTEKVLSVIKANPTWGGLVLSTNILNIQPFIGNGETIEEYKGVNRITLETLMNYT